MTSKEPQNTEEEGGGVKSAPVMWLLALDVIMMGFLIYELFLLQLPKIEKRELPEKAKYCLEELKAYSTIKTLEMGGHIRPTGEFIEEMRECYRRKGWEVKR